MVKTDYCKDHTNLYGRPPYLNSATIASDGTTASLRFNITLASEIEWVPRHTAYTPENLAKRLGDARRFAIKRWPQVNENWLY